VTSDPVAKRAGDIRDARLLYPATEEWVYFNTAAVGLASRAVADALSTFVSEWMANGLDFVRTPTATVNAWDNIVILSADAGG